MLITEFVDSEINIDYKFAKEDELAVCMNFKMTRTSFHVIHLLSLDPPINTSPDWQTNDH